MGRHVVRRNDEAQWRRQPSSGGGSEAQTKALSPGDESTPQVLLVKYAPGSYSGIHSHSQLDIMYVLEGDMKVGGRPCPKGAVVWTDKDTMYGPLEVGPQGVTLLDIRPARANTVWQSSKP